MIQHEFTRHANWMKASYEGYLGSLRGAYVSGVASGKTGSVKMKSTVARHMTDTAIRFAELMQNQARRAGEAIRDEAIKAAINDLNIELSSKAKALIEQKFQALTQEMVILIGSQVKLDWNKARDKYNKITNVVAGKMNLEGDTKTLAIQLMQEDEATIDFTYIDTLNRKWKSQEYVRIVMRGYLLTIYNEAYTTILKNSGVTQAQITNIRKNHKWNGKKIVLGGSDKGDMTYVEARKVVFHPNSRSIVTMLDD